MKVRNAEEEEKKSRNGRRRVKHLENEKGFKRMPTVEI